MHAVAVLSRAHTSTRTAHWLATAMTLLIAAAACRLSLTALRALADSAGMPASESWLLPIIMEGSMTQSTIALLALAHAGTRRRPAPLESDIPIPTTSTKGKPPHRDPSSAHAITNHPSIVHTADRLKPETPIWVRLAEVICSNDPAHRRDPRLVTEVLMLHFTDGHTPPQIAREINLSRSAVSRIIGQATELLPQRPRAPERERRAVPVKSS